MSVPEQHVIAIARRVGQHEWRRAIRGQMTPTVFAVAQALASYTNKDGSNAYPGNERLAADLCCTTKTVQRALKWLRDNHWLQLDAPSSAPGKGRGLAQKWSLTIPDWWTSETRLVDTGVQLPDPAIHQSSSLTLAQPSVERDTDNLNEEPRPILDVYDPNYDAYEALQWIDREVDGLDPIEHSHAESRLQCSDDSPMFIRNSILADRRRAA